VAAVQQFEQVLAERLIGVHISSRRFFLSDPGECLAIFAVTSSKDFNREGRE